ncbi:putative Fe superoxide dismutase [Talaromyces proteolyticus]|uniref:Fe superoxide dismutase n=1 Tax=Talaromyces proteolyticus TaxID=1131652 RepID=A0AAD4Q296_9EURO|nr:putative Fe superoxide dismutase [Talaromyces proteolyticus]KAH8700146.1 putative Fe superoxide dismutase [Talaromyces proteolyticus]
MLQRLLRPHSCPRAASIANGCPRIQSRGLHRVPQLTYESRFAQNGVPDLLSPEAFDLAWIQYQKHLVDKLNLLTQDTVDADIDTLTLVKKYAKRREMAHVFNYASMAHNNHFFFNRLAPVEVPMSPQLMSDMSDSASSPESLKQDFLAAASAQFGPGFVWLVSQEEGGLLRILSTYNTGTPYPEAFARQQSVDMNTEPPAPASKKGWGFNNTGASPVLAPGGRMVTPLLCVNTWEHVWLMNYGVGGKDEYLERWWSRVDWNAVEDAHKGCKGYDMSSRKRIF